MRTPFLLHHCLGFHLVSPNLKHLNPHVTLYRNLNNITIPNTKGRSNYQTNHHYPKLFFHFLLALLFSKASWRALFCLIFGFVSSHWLLILCPSCGRPELFGATRGVQYFIYKSGCSDTLRFSRLKSFKEFSAA